MLKKPLSLLLTLVMLISCLPNVSFAESIVVDNTILMSDVATVRNGNSHKNVVQSTTQVVTDYSGNNRRFTYVKFDLADYRNDIDNISEVKFSFVPYTPVSNITLEVLPDSMESWSSSTLTYSIAEADGMAATDSSDILCTVDGLTNGTRAYTPDLSAAVKSHLKNNTSNTVVCFKLHSTQGNLSVIYGNSDGKKPELAIKLSVDINEILQKTYDELTFDKINECSSDAVSKNFDFVTSGSYGTTITWSSSDDAVNTSNGIIKRPVKGEGDKAVTLTATISNTGYSLTKEFDIILTESNIYSDDLVLEKFCYAADSTFVRSGRDYADVIVNNGDVVCDPKSFNRMGYVKFDFTELEEYLEKANSMQLRIDTKTDANVSNHSNFVAYLLPQDKEDIDTSTLTYNIANSKGIVDYWDNLLFEQKDVAKVTTYYSGDILPAIMENIRNGGDKIVWIKFASTEGVGYTVNGSVAGDAVKPALIIKYPKPATELDSRTMTMDRVVDSDIQLPSVGEYGSLISWSSSDEELISSSGEVRVDTADEDYSKEDSVANLTATFTADGVSVTKTYAVRVRRTGVHDAAESATITSDGIVSDSPTLSVGGTVGRITLLDFDVTDNLSVIKTKRKTVLKLYGSEGYENKSLTLVPITDTDVLTNGIDSLTYAGVKQLTEESNPYKLSANFEDNSYLTFDITEYLYSLSGNRAVFALCSADPQIILESQSGTLCKEPKLIVSPHEYTDSYAAQSVADEIEFSDLSSESNDLVRNNLFLPTSGRFGSVISWHSSNEQVVSSDGTVTRGADNTNVTLTATITVGGQSVTKTFEICVRKSETDLEYAASLVQNLAPERDILTSSIVLKGDNLPDGAVARWESSQPYEATVNGFNLELTRPNSSDLPVVLTAYVTYNGQTASKSYNVTVVRSANKNILRNRKITEGDADASKAIDEAIETAWNITNPVVVYDFNSSKVISGITLVPEEASFENIKISMSEDGYQWKNVYSGGSFAAGKLNYISFATVAYGRYIKLEFPSTAKKISFIGAYSFTDDTDSTDDVFSGISIPSEMTSDYALTQTVYGSYITWTSSSASVVIDGYIAKPVQDAYGKNVTLTAEVTINDQKHVKSFSTYVPAYQSGGGASTGGGGGFVSAGSATGSAPVPTQPTPGTQKGFSDISSVPWAADYINTLADKGIINGKSDSSFAPNDNLKREEMAKILSLAFNLSADASSAQFADVDTDSWYSAYVSALYENNISKGMGDGSFGVGYDITRQDAFTMLALVLKLDTSTDAGSATEFGDDNEIADYARGSIIALKAIGIVGGDDKGNVNPNAKITRAEIAKVICLAIEK